MVARLEWVVARRSMAFIRLIKFEKGPLCSVGWLRRWRRPTRRPPEATQDPRRASASAPSPSPRVRGVRHRPTARRASPRSPLLTAKRRSFDTPEKRLTSVSADQLGPGSDVFPTDDPAWVGANKSNLISFAIFNFIFKGDCNREPGQCPFQHELPEVIDPLSNEWKAAQAKSAEYREYPSTYHARRKREAAQRQTPGAAPEPSSSPRPPERTLNSYAAMAVQGLHENAPTL